jgi:outer membrane lipoprotein
MMKRCLIWGLFLLPLTPACARHPIPPHLEQQIAQEISFARLKQDPNAHRGQVVLLGGRLLSAARAEHGTMLEVLQIPLSDYAIPEESLRHSEGRFLALDRDRHIVDPTLLEADARLTVVGEVLGSTRMTIGEHEEHVPKVAIRHLMLWHSSAARAIRIR